MGFLRPKVICADGFTISIQASRTHYSTPRADDAGPYAAVECGFPSEREDDLMEWIDSPADDPTHTVYGYVPANVIRAVIEKHGGLVEGEMPPLAAS